MQCILLMNCLNLSCTFELTQVTAEFSQHAIWVGSGHLGEACQNQNITVLQGALVHRLGEEKKRHFKREPDVKEQLCRTLFSAF